MLAHILQDYQPYLPFLALIALGLGVVAIFLLLLMAKKLTRRSAQRMALMRPAAARPSFGERYQTWRTTSSSFFSRLQSMWARWKEQPEDGNAQSFKEAIQVLKSFLSGSNPEYRLPWYLMIGPVRSGKTAILEDVDLELPLGKPEQVLTSRGDLDWWFYDRGVVVDTRGTLFLSEKEAESDEAEWDKLLQLFVHHRAKRPLDGLILTIPATDLYGPARPEYDDVMDRARYIYGKLWKLQSKLGMRLPVYIIVTKCDVIPGFKGFVAETPSHTHNDMFGWSCPYSLEVSFASNWLNDIFNYMHRALVRTRTAIFTEGKLWSERDGNFIFASEFYQLKEGLGNYLNTIFKDSAYHESFFLRGVYFTGKAATESLTPLQGGTPFEQAELEPTLSNQEDSIPSRKEKGVFLRDLFEKKIFREAGLGQPILRLMVSTNRKLNILKSVAAGFFILWTGSVIHQSNRLREDNKTLVPALASVDNALKGVNQHAWKKGSLKDNPLLLNYLEEQAESILEHFAFIKNVDTFALSMPSSWVSSLDRRIERAFTTAYNRIILPSISAALTKRGAELASLQHIEYGNQHQNHQTAHLYLNPVLSPTFIALQSFVDNLITYEQAVEKYNNIEKTRSMNDLGYLLKYLFNKDLPAQFYSNTKYYETALGVSVDPAVDLNPIKVPAGQKLGLLFKSFLDSAFNIHQNYPGFAALQKNLNEFANFSGAHALDDHNLRALVGQAISVADIISSGEFSWLDKHTFAPASSYTQLMSHITTSQILGQPLALELTQIANRAFVHFKFEFAGFKTNLTGPFFAVRDSQIVSDPSEGLVNFIDAATAFLNESFMLKSDIYSLVKKVPVGKLLFWDEMTLQKGGQLIDAYTEYVTQHVQQAPETLRNIFKIIARNSLRKKVTSVVAQAQTFQSQPMDYAGITSREILQSQVHNVASVTPQFTKILGAFEESAFVIDAVAIRQLLIEQTYDILSKVDKLLDEENLYSAREEEFEMWNGEAMVGLRAFAVHDLGDMKNYLNAQRYRVNFLSHELAEPILTLLSLGFLEGAPSDLPLVFKWSRIAAILQDYDKQSPSNSLKILENFLSYDINELSLENCTLGQDEGGDFDIAGDYFLEIRNRYSRELMDRCQSLNGRKAIERFNRAAQFFNTNLSGRFPFTGEDSKASTFEADPADVETFFQLLDGLNKQEVNALLEASRTIGSQDSVRQFMREVDSIRPLMLAALDRGMNNQIPAIKLQVSFRTDRHRETGGDKIIDWSMDFGDRKIDFRRDDPIAHWHVGAPIDIDLRWALDSDSVPIGDPRKPDLTVVGPKATFSYRGRWSLIRLIREHAVAESRADISDTPQPQVLEFQVPTAYSPSCYRGRPPLVMDRKSEAARIFCRLSLQVPIKSNKAGEEVLKANQMRTLAVPRFPVVAPLIESFKLKRFRQAAGGR